MSKFVIKRKHEDDCGEGKKEHKGGNMSERKRTVPTSGKTDVIRKKKRRLYLDSYLGLGFTLCGDEVNSMPECVICGDKLANEAMVPSKLKRHFTTKHGHLTNKPRSYFERLLNERKQQNLTLSKIIKVSNKAQEASYLVAELLAKNMKPRSEAETLILPACSTIVKTMFGNEAEKEVKKIPLSDNTKNKQDDTRPKRVAVTQMTASRDKEANFITCVDLVRRAVESGAQMVFLPEACDYIAESKEESVQFAESINGPLVSKYQKLAAEVQVWLSLGGLHIKETEDKIRNTHIVIDNTGKIVSTYSKAHLFSVHIPERNLHLEEKAYVSPGKAILPPISTPVGAVALSICYDVRFPEMSLIQRKLGAQILTFPSAFTVTTGLAHWEALLRVRAIETQCYVIAAAQTGQHNKKRSSYGHAMVVDPWGAVVCQVSEGTNFALADINLDYLQNIRQEMPVLSHRRLDLYHILDMQFPDYPRICELLPFPSSYVSYQFGTVSVPGSCVFLKTQLSQAFVNKRPIVPGHVLLTPERPAKRFHQLQVPELSDLAQLTQKALEVIMCCYQEKTCQIAIQDGPAAGQTIDHIHIHIVPLNPSLNQKLQGHEEDGTEHWRDTNEMQEEASQLRQSATQILPNFYNVEPGIPCNTCVEIPEPECLENFQFGSVQVPNSCVIVKTKHTYVFVAPSPVLPGHIYVTFLKPCAGYRKASAEQVTDFFIVMQSAERLVETSHKAESSTIILLEDADLIQDQNLHVHAHIIPRTEDDLANNDNVYVDVLNHFKQHSEWTFSQEVIAYASHLRRLWLELNN